MNGPALVSLSFQTMLKMYNLVHCVISQDCWEEEEEEATPKLQLIEWVMSAFKK